MKYEISFTFRGQEKSLIIDDTVVDLRELRDAMLLRFEGDELVYVSWKNEDDAQFMLPGHMITLIEPLD